MQNTKKARIKVPISRRNSEENIRSLPVRNVALGIREEEEEDYSTDYQFSYSHLFLGIISIILFVADIGSFKDDELILGTVTIILVAGSSLVICCLGIHWHWIEQKKITQDNDNYLPHNSLWILRFVCTILQIGPLLRTFEYLYNGWKSFQAHKKKAEAEKFKYHKRMLNENVDLCLLRLFEGFLEAAPQLIFQLYAWATLKPNEDVVSLSMRIIFLLLSWVSLGFTLMFYQTSLRYSRHQKNNLSKTATRVYFIWRSCEVGARILCISLFAITFELWIFLPLLVHWVIVSWWLIQQKIEIYHNFWLDKIFNVICGYVMIFCFLNLREGTTRFRYIIFYVLFYFENVCMIGTWLLFRQSQGVWYELWGLIAVIVLSILHIIIQLLFYKCFHPEYIKRWLPCNRNRCFQSICYDLETEDDKSVSSNSHEELEMQNPTNNQPLMTKNSQNKPDN